MDEIFERKDEHIKIAVESDVELQGESLLDEVYLIHYACSEVCIDEVDLKTRFLNHEFKAPIVIEALTGGTKLGEKINRMLARIAEEYGLAMGVGSQRIAVEKREAEKSFRVVREEAPTAFIIANIGAAQLVEERGLEYAIKAVDMISADALAVHLNLLHEVLQVRGDACFRGLLSKLKLLVKELNVPVIVKEVGYGLSKEAAVALRDTGVHALDVAGKGGTCWSKIEEIRARRRGDFTKVRLAKVFENWGLPTAIAILEVRSILPKIPLIGSGGVRTGLDVAKVIALGADMAGVALPFVRLAYKGDYSKVLEYVNTLILELKYSLILTGCRNLKELREGRRYVVSEKIVEWLKQRGITL